MPLTKIISGGQTGVDRAALDAAIEVGFPHGGWCPAGRRAEDGRISDEYDLRETESADYAVRTERNVEDSDGTLIISDMPLTGGTLLTKRLARDRKRPILVVDAADGLPGQILQSWLKANGIGTLNVAGPRASKAPWIYDDVRASLEEYLRGIGAAVDRSR